MRKYITSKILFNTDNICEPGRNTRTHSGTKYSAYNKEFWNQKMEYDPIGTNDVCGYHDPKHTFKLREGMDTPEMYPGETWFRNNIDKL